MASESRSARVVEPNRRTTTLDRIRTPFAVEHVSVIPLGGAVAAVATGTHRGWTIAAMCLALAYLFVFVTARR